MPWVCGKCGSQRIDIYTPKDGLEERQCSCGNIIFVGGIKPRWPITYQEFHKEGCDAGRLGTEHPGEPKSMSEKVDTELVSASDLLQTMTSPCEDGADVRTGIGLSADRTADTVEAPVSATKTQGVRMARKRLDPPAVMPVICQRVVDVQKFYGLSDGKFAERIGVCKTVPRKIALGRQPAPKTITGIMDAFPGISPVWLGTGRGEMLLQAACRPKESAAIYQADLQELPVYERHGEKGLIDYDRLAEVIASKISADALAHAIVERIYSRLTTKHIVFKFNGSEEEACRV
jgi:hypothetical protein